MLENSGPSHLPPTITWPDPSTRLVRKGLRVGHKENVDAFLARYLIVEVVGIASGSYLAELIYGEASWYGWTPGAANVASALLLAVGIPAVSLSLKHYAAFQLQPVHRALRNAAAAVTIAFSLLLSGLFLLKAATEYSRGAFLLQLIVVSATVLGVRAVAHARLRAAIANDRAEARRAVVFGTEDAYATVAKSLAEAGMKIVRLAPIPASALAMDGEIERDAQFRIIDACRAERLDEIVILTKAVDLPKAVRFANFLSELPLSVHLVPTDAAELFRSARLSEVGKLVTIELTRLPMTLADRIAKRIFDIAAAGAGLILLLPLFAIVAIAIKLDSRGPVLFRQTRHGYNNDVFSVFKFRSMRIAEEGHTFTQAKKNDPRVTRVGRILRRTNIDESPQLLNVLMGEMSIVGPRPHPIAMNKNFEQHISPLSRRHNVKPGITGWAQVNGYRGETDTLEKMQRRFECDIYYIENWSFALDLKIILMTIYSPKVYTNAY